ncbi:MAG: type II toxin-antitoxin system VapC family toxin [Rhizobiales bacterium]|nr:type II toxin-antitoxin system VapC family toxin [Hyphomicrobiales bacterium]
MIVLDTNVLLELMKPEASRAVLTWVGGQARDDLYTSAITLGEIMFGLEIMPHGRKRDVRLQLADEIFGIDFAGRILPFDVTAARAFAVIAATRRRAGRPIEMPDAQIAAIARAHRMAVATRNVADFADCGVDLINPWEG